MADNTIIMSILLGLLVVSALGAVMIRSMLKASIALAAVSVLLTIVMFLLGSPLAAVFELSVCAGLITAIFVSAVSMTESVTKEELAVEQKERIRRFIYLPVLLVLAAVGIILAWPSIHISLTAITDGNLSVETALWDARRLDMLGQIIIILAGAFGVVVLFKDREEK